MLEIIIVTDHGKPVNSFKEQSRATQIRYFIDHLYEMS